MDDQTRTEFLRRFQAHAAHFDEVAARRQKRARQPAGDADTWTSYRAPLTAREHAVLDLVAQGFGDKEIAELIGISTHTVNAHLRHVYAKLPAKNRAHAVAVAVRTGVLRLAAIA